VAKGKEKSKINVEPESKMRDYEEDAISEDWDQEEMELAMQVSR